MESSNPHAVIVSSPGVGHLVRDIELGNRLVTDHNFRVTFFVVLEYQATTGESQLIQSAKAQKLLDIVELPPVDLSGQLQPNTLLVTRLTAVMREIRETLRYSISALKPTPIALLVDLFGTPVLDVADEFRMLKYVFVSSAWPLALMLYAPILDKEVEGEYVDQKEPIRLPGCMPVRPQDMLNPMMDRTNQDYHSFLEMGSKTRKSDGVLVNTWEDLDAAVLNAVREEESYGSALVYAVGPLIRSVGPPASRSQLLDWLDEQPVESVLYIAS
jgi:coniferyl-alcohol glucosyltransferase